MKAYSIGRKAVGPNGETIGSPTYWQWDPPSLTDDFHFVTVCDLRPLKWSEDKYGKRIPAKGVDHLYLGPLMVDIDNGDLKAAFETSQLVLNTFLKMGLSKSSTQWRVFFSGSKGYHIEVDPSVIGISQHTKSLPYIYKHMMMQLDLLQHVDNSVYSLGWGRQWRRPNIPRLVDDGSGNPTLGPCKVYLTYDEFLLGPEAHVELAVKPKPVVHLSQDEMLPEFHKIYLEAETALRNYRDNGYEKKEVQELLHYAYQFDLADCVRKILDQDNSISESSNTHDQVFKLVLYFHHTGHTYERALEKSVLWLQKHKSRSYPTPQARRLHFQHQFEHVKGTPEYRFSCQAMRSTVESPACELCPLNKDFFPKPKTYGVIEQDRQYQSIRKEGKEFVVRPISNFTIRPTKKAQTTDPMNPQSTFLGDILFNDGRVAKNRLFDLSWIDKPDIFRKHMGEITGTEHVISCIAGSNQMQGVRMLIDLHQRGIPIFLDAGMAQGIHMFKGNNGCDGYYYVDIQGCRDEEWKPSNNVHLSHHVTPAQPISRLSAYEPIPKENRKDFSAPLRMLRKINSPKVIYPLLGWYFAAAFRSRFRKLGDQRHIPHVDNFPLFFYQGEASTGKTLIAEYVLKPLYGMKYPPIEIAGHSIASLRKSILCTSNTFPVILDEWKDQMFSRNSRSAAISEGDVKSLVRSAWDESFYTRGTKEGKTVEFAIQCPLLLMGPVIPECFDQAMRDRTITITGSPQTSRVYENDWKTFLSYITDHPDFLPRIGATLIHAAMTMSDHEILKVYEYAHGQFQSISDQIRSRKYVGLTKMIFGHAIMSILFKESLSWDLLDVLPHLLSSVGVYTSGDGEISDVDVDQSDWDLIMDDILMLCNIHIEKDFQLQKDQEYFFKHHGGELVFIVDLHQAFRRRKQYYRSQGEQPTGMDPKPFARQALAKGFLQPWPGNELIQRNMTIKLKGGRKASVRGAWIQLSVRSMKHVDRGKQVAYEFENVPGAVEKMGADQSMFQGLA